MSAETLIPEGAAVSLGAIGQLQLYSVSVLADSDFYVASDVSPSNGYAYQLFGEEFTPSGAPIGSTLDLSNGFYGPDAYGRPVTGFAVPSSAALPDGNIALMYSYLSGPGEQHGLGAELVLLGSTGTPYYSQSIPDPGGYHTVTLLAGGNTLLLYNGSSGAAAAVKDVTSAGTSVAAADATFYFTDPDGANLLPWTASLGSAGFMVGMDRTVEYFNGSSYSALTAADPVVSAAQLANGEVLLLQVASLSGTVVYGQTFDPATDTLGTQKLIYSGLPGYSFPSILATPDGGYVMDWGAGGSTTGLYVDSSGQVGSPFSALGTLYDTLSGQIYATAVVNGQITVQDYTLQAGSTGTEALTLTVEPVTLSYAQGWTSAAVLPSGAVAVVGAAPGAYGSHQGAEHTYDANGNETASTELLGFAGNGQALTPEITALPVGGFYEVTYAGSSNYEVYNANDQMVFAHNQWTSPTEILSPLANGGYVTTDSASSVFGLFNSSNQNVGWITMPSDAPSGTPTVDPLNGGGFVFTYAGTNHFDLYGASGNLLEGGAFSASGSQFAQGFAPLAGSGDGFVEAWLSPDGSTYNGVATALDIQAMGPHGAITPAITLAQDLDPWGTTFKLESHADGSVAVLWSEGGAVFGAEYANGQAGPAHGALPGDLATTVAVQLPNDMEGFAWIMNGDAWAEIFNPATGQVQSADLGPSSSTDISSVHALATAQGGLAVSWREASGVKGAVVNASGQLGTMTGLAGDLLGVNASGQAITLHDNGAGTPILQTYALDDGLFWVH